MNKPALALCLALCLALSVLAVTGGCAPGPAANSVPAGPVVKPAMPSHDALVEQRIQEGIEWMAEHRSPWKGEFWRLHDAYARQLADKTENADELNQAVLAYCAAYPVKAETPPTPYSDQNIPSFIFQLYLKPDKQKLLSPESKAAIEQICWNWVYRHSYLESPLDHKGRPSHYNNATMSVWYITGSENHDARQRASNLLATQVLMAAAEPHGPDGKLYDGHTVAEHHDAWVQWYIEFFRQRAREGLTCEIAHPASYGAGTISDYYAIENCTNDPALKRQAGKFLTLFWANVAVEFEPRTGIRAGLASTRNYKYSWNQSGSIYWARGLLYAYGWTDEPSPGSGISNFASDYRPPEILRAIAHDPEREAYRVTSRRFGRSNGSWHYGVYQIFFDDGDAMNSYMRRDTWYTPDYALSTLSFDLSREYCALVSQSRMMGVTFSHDVDDRLMVYAGNTPADGKVEYKMGIMKGVNGVLGRDCIVVARDLNIDPKSSNCTRIFVSDDALWDNRIDDETGWTFTRAGDGYAAFRIAGDQGYSIEQSPWKNGWYLEFKDIWAPVVVQTGQTRNYKSFEDFQASVKKNPFSYQDGKLTYTSEAKETFEYWANSTNLPTVNGQPVDLNPENTYDSPYLKMKHGSDKAVISYPGYDDLVLEF